VKYVNINVKINKMFS